MSIRIKSNHNRKNSPIMPKDIRCMIVGTSGCGKTSLLSQMLLEEGLLDYEKLIICCPMIEQDSYKFVIDGFSSGCGKAILSHLVSLSQEQPFDVDHLEQFFVNFRVLKQYVAENKDIDDETKDLVKFVPEVITFDQIDLVPQLHDWSKEDKKLIVFDDVLEENQKIIEPYFTKARHKNFDTIYLAQNYCKTPRQCIRTNLNMLILFNLNSDDSNRIFRDHVYPDMTKEQFNTICEKGWSEPFGYIVIDKTRLPMEGKYRLNLKTWVTECV